MLPVLCSHHVVEAPSNTLAAHPLVHYCSLMINTTNYYLFLQPQAHPWHARPGRRESIYHMGSAPSALS
jgi:hypothetical protein